MIDRFVMFGLAVLLSADVQLLPILGSRTPYAIVVPLALLAYRAAVIRCTLSPAYRQVVGGILRRAASSPMHAILLSLFTLMLVVSFMRGASAGTLDLVGATLLVVKWTSIIILLFSIVVSGELRSEESTLIRATIVSLFVFNLANATLFAAGVTNTVAAAQYVGAQEPGIMFGLLGMNIPRAAPPLAAGINTAGLQAAVGLAVGLVLALRMARFKYRVLAVVLAGASTLMILLADSRGAMLAGLGAAALALLLPGMLKLRAKWLAITVPVLPVVLIVVLQSLSNQSWLSDFSRSGTSSVALLTGRPFIWASILASLATFRLDHLFGFGALGQITAGVSAQYGIFFAKNYASPYTMGAHNALLQAILDVGYVGALIQVALLWYLLRYFGRSDSDDRTRRWWTDAGLAGTLCLLLLGITGETFSFTTPITLLLFLVLNVHCLTVPRSLPMQSPSPEAP